MSLKVINLKFLISYRIFKFCKLTLIFFEMTIIKFQNIANYPFLNYKLAPQKFKIDPSKF